MASVKEIKEAIDDLSNTSLLDIKALKEKAIEATLKAAYPEATIEEIKEMANNMIKSGSYYVREVENSLNEISSMIQSIPSQVASIQTTIATIPAAFGTIFGGSGVAAGVQSLAAAKAQVGTIKAQIRNCLSMAVKLNIPIPGIDPVLKAAKIIKNL